MNSSLNSSEGQRGYHSRWSWRGGSDASGSLLRPEPHPGYVVTPPLLKERGHREAKGVRCFLLLLLLPLLLPLAAFGQAPDTLWTKVYGDSSRNELSGLAKTADGGFIVVGYTGSGPAGGNDAWVLRLDSNGDTLWTRTFGGIKNDLAVGVKQTADAGFIIFGTKGAE